MMTHSQPRSGLAGVWARFAGPGATPSETFVMAAGAFGLTAVTLVYALAADLG